MSSGGQPLSLPGSEELEMFLRELKGAVSDRAYGIAETLVGLVRQFAQELDRGRASLARLRDLVFGSSSKKRRDRSERKDGGGTGADPKRRRPRGNPAGQGHGRNSLKRGFWGAIRHLVLHPFLTSGSACGSDCSGRMNVLDRVRTTARIFGQPFLPMIVWERQGLRCSACQRIDWAPLPAHAAGPRYDPTAISMLAVMVYLNGMPLSRIARHQESCGVPIPETVQWALLAGLAEQLAPVWEALLEQAAQGDLFHSDDTHRKILSLLAGADGDGDEEGVADPDSGKKERSGTFTTAIVSCGEGRKIALFFTGRRHAGENLQELLRRRCAGRPKPLQMSDALSRNVPAGFDTVLCNCLAHARSKVKELRALFPEQVEHVLEELGKVFGVEARARRERLDDAERLARHRRESLPVLDALCGWLEAQFAQKAVEPNSALGSALSYLLNHWYQLTQFTRVPGAPLDNNLCERILKMAIRHRKNSLFYKTPRGAAVGDRLMSLLCTCQLAGVDPFGYLTVLQRHREAVAADPAAWLPWNYQQALAAAPVAAAAGQAPDVLREPQKNVTAPEASQQTSAETSVAAREVTRPEPTMPASDARASEVGMTQAVTDRVESRVHAATPVESSEGTASAPGSAPASTEAGAPAQMPDAPSRDTQPPGPPQPAGTEQAVRAIRENSAGSTLALQSRRQRREPRPSPPRVPPRPDPRYPPARSATRNRPSGTSPP